jgi:hypothetical protein
MTQGQNLLHCDNCTATAGAALSPGLYSTLDAEEDQATLF